MLKTGGKVDLRPTGHKIVRHLSTYTFLVLFRKTFIMKERYFGSISLIVDSVSIV